MFFGQFVHSCDDNNRLTIPANLEGLRMNPVVVTQGFDRNLLVMPVDVFENLCQVVMGLNIADPLARRLQRLLIGNADYCEIDQVGMIKLPPSLVEFAGINTEAVWVGQGKYLELWSLVLWRQQEIELQDFESNTQRFASLSITGL